MARPNYKTEGARPATEASG